MIFIFLEKTEIIIDRPNHLNRIWYDSTFAVPMSARIMATKNKQLEMITPMKRPLISAKIKQCCNFFPEKFYLSRNLTT